VGWLSLVFVLLLVLVPLGGVDCAPLFGRLIKILIIIHTTKYIENINI
jgi:hypothetical protein